VTTEFPYGAFWWRSPDGTELLSVMSEWVKALIRSKWQTACDWEKQTSRLPLVSGCWRPRRSHPRYAGGAKTLATSPSSPAEFSTAQSIYNTLATHLTYLPVWSDELYLNFIAAATPLMQIRRIGIVVVKGLLYQAELFASLATLSWGSLSQVGFVSCLEEGAV